MRLIILSASSRYLAESAIRAGIDVQAIDFFSDWDLRQLSVRDGNAGNLCREMRDFQDGFKLVEFAGWDGIILGGGAENFPDLFDAVESKAKLIGTQPDALRRLSDSNSPVSISTCLKRLPITAPVASFPNCKSSLCEFDQPNRWLRKKLSGAGGHHVREASARDLGEAAKPGWIFQERVDGKLISAVFLVSPGEEVGDCNLLAATRQLVGEREFGAHRFAYCGSVGPIALDEDLTSKISQIGQALSGEFQIQGVFGVDFIVANNGSRIWPIDINPRIPASAEVVELALQAVSGSVLNDCSGSVVGLHVQACTDWGSDCPALDSFGESSKRIAGEDVETKMFGKVVVFCQNPNGVEIGNEQFERIRNLHGGDLEVRHRQSRWVADVPSVGQRIEFGHPVATLFARGKLEGEVYETLIKFARDFRSLIGC